MTCDIGKGDLVRVTLTGKVDYVNGDKSVDVIVDLIDGDKHSIEYVPRSALAVTKRAAPPEPGVGSIIVYYSNKYIRTDKGWRYLNTTTGQLEGIASAWNVFNHDVVFLMSAASAPMSNR